MNGFTVDPGSNGSVIAVDGRLLRIEPPARHREDLAVVRIENDDVAALGAHARDGVGERLLGDLLQVGVDREHDAVALHRRRARRDRRFAALALRIAEDRRRARHSMQDGVERQLESVDRLVVARSRARRFPARPADVAYERVDRRERVHAAQRHRLRASTAGNRPGTTTYFAPSCRARARSTRGRGASAPAPCEAWRARALRAARSRAAPSRGSPRSPGASRRGSRRAARERCATSVCCCSAIARHSFPCTSCTRAAFTMMARAKTASGRERDRFG